MKKIRLGLLGLGTVGSGVVKLLQENGKSIKEREGVDLEIVRILVRDKKARRNVTVDEALLTTEAADILNDESIDIVAEFLGHEEPAFTFIKTALENGKSVVTANKEVIAKHWDELEATAAKAKTGLYYEASVGGGIPIINAIRTSLQSNQVKRVMGIINGTTNYILTRMSEDGLSYHTALEGAQALGYAEPDPTADVEGFDARYKLSILATLAFRNRVKIEDIYCEGITRITPEDIHFAKDFGYAIKLMAIAKKENGRIEARVHPTLISLSHPLAGVKDSFNAVFVEGNMVGDLMFYGRGAGDLPTASALVADMLTAARRKSTHYQVRLDKEEAVMEKDWRSAFYIRVRVLDKPGVFAEIAEIFGRYGVSLNSVLQTTRGEEYATIIFITHEANESWIKSVIEGMEASKSVLSVDSVLRVES